MTEIAACHCFEHLPMGAERETGSMGPTEFEIRQFLTKMGTKICFLTFEWLKWILTIFGPSVDKSVATPGKIDYCPNWKKSFGRPSTDHSPTEKPYWKPCINWKAMLKAVKWECAFLHISFNTTKSFRFVLRFVSHAVHVYFLCFIACNFFSFLTCDFVL